MNSLFLGNFNLCCVMYDKKFIWLCATRDIGRPVVLCTFVFVRIHSLYMDALRHEIIEIQWLIGKTSEKS